MSFTEKIDVLDMVIDILVDHEKTLISLIDRLEKLVDRLEEDLRLMVIPTRKVHEEAVAQARRVHEEAEAPGL